MKIITSFSPTRIDAQKRALETWKKYNIPIQAVQCIGENYAMQFVSDIIWVQPNIYWSKRTPSIVDMLPDEPALIVNSDIEMLEPDLSRWEDEAKTLKIGLRTDYVADSQIKELNKYGIDIFSFHPEMKAVLRNPLWALGIPGWDYWYAYKLYQCGYQVKFFNDQIMHEAHAEQWQMKDHKRCCHLLEWEFEITTAEISVQLQAITNRLNLPRPRRLA